MVKVSKFHFIFFILLIACKDQQLVIRRSSGQVENNSIRLNGFYWSKVVNPKEVWYKTFFLYKNGTLLYGGGINNINTFPKDMADFRKYTRMNSDSVVEQTTKSSWGIYNIKGKSFEFEKWEPSSGGPLKTVIRRGRILNDTTFIITEKINHYDGKTYQVQDTFHFMPYSPKPDSTNRFIKE